MDGTRKETLFSNWVQRNADFKTISEVTAGKIVIITAEHYSNIAHDFYGSIFFEIR